MPAAQTLEAIQQLGLLHQLPKRQNRCCSSERLYEIKKAYTNNTFPYNVLFNGFLSNFQIIYIPILYNHS